MDIKIVAKKWINNEKVTDEELLFLIVETDKAYNNAKAFGIDIKVQQRYLYMNNIMKLLAQDRKLI